MFVQLGGKRMVRATDVVAVLDVRMASGSEINQGLVDTARAGKHLLGTGFSPDCKALGVTKTGVIAATISPSTFARRMTHSRRVARVGKRET